MRRGLAITVRVAAVPFWYPFAALSWIGERSECAFWWIERHLPQLQPKRTGVCQVCNDPDCSDYAKLLDHEDRP